MSIYRGTGGASSTTSSANVEAVLEASVQATNAAAAASTSETNAASSAASASTSAANAAASESGVAADAAAASASATASANSASAASTSASAASTSETNAAASATSASTSATTATTKASEASVSASNAATSETNAANSATASATSATSSASSASASAASATASAASATAAATSEANAATSATDAAAALDEFTDVYLGAKASAPTVDNDGDPLQTGALYFNTTTNDVWLYDGAAWTQAAFTSGGFATETYVDNAIAANTVGSVVFENVTASKTLEVGFAYRIVAQSDVTLTLPATANNGDTIRIQEYGAISVYGSNITIARNGNTIETLSEDFILNTPYITIDLWYDNGNWRFY